MIPFQQRVLWSYKNWYLSKCGSYKIPHTIPYLFSTLATSSCINLKLVYSWQPSIMNIKLVYSWQVGLQHKYKTNIPGSNNFSSLLIHSNTQQQTTLYCFNSMSKHPAVQLGGCIACLVPSLQSFTVGAYPAGAQLLSFACFKYRFYASFIHLREQFLVFTRSVSSIDCYFQLFRVKT